MAKVFVADDDEAWLPAVLESKEATQAKVMILADPEALRVPGNVGVNSRIVENARGSSRTVKIDEKQDGNQGGLPLRDDAVFVGEGVLDMTNLNYLHEAAILYNLRTRFFAARPYTYTGDICIALNPYQWLDIYTEATRKEYFIFGRAELPPHVYATSACAFNGIQEGGPCQSILVSGESGAGKTETVKILMAHVAYIAAGDDQSVIKRILESNPLLETFGNAKTLRNDNSSRFGKFTELQFDKTSRLVGSVSRTYLLEKSRVVFQTPGERNFHAFHQLLGASSGMLEKLDLAGIGDLAYVSENSTETLIEGKTDSERLDITCNALELINVDETARGRFFEIIAAILHIGQLKFKEKDGDSEKSSVENQDGLSPVAQLLGVDPSSFSVACTERTMVARDDVYKVPLKAAEAAGAASGLGKELYSRLFDHLVKQINVSTSASLDKVHRTIALLDIFGFEMFKVNSFEQLCINYANEKLQQKFTHDVFKTVQTEYEEEGICWETITFTDNAATLSLIDARMGVISVLNEECMRPMGNDEAFTSKLTTLHAKHPDFSKPRLNARKCFTVHHYAGPVTYTSDGFLEKNKDALQEDLVECMRGSSNGLVVDLFAKAAAAEDAEASGGKKKGGSLVQLTVSTKFKTQLGQLMGTIGATSVQYVRCIKPNQVKSKDVFTMNMVVEQLRCAGVIEAIRISRAGFPNKVKHGEFMDRFGLLAPTEAALAVAEVSPLPSSPKKGAPPSPTSVSSVLVLTASCKAVLLKVLTGREDHFEIGKTRVYFKAGILEELEALRAQVLEKSATVVQRYYRGCNRRHAFLLQKTCSVRLQAFARMLRARVGFKQVVAKIVRVQSLARARESCALTKELRKFVRSRAIQSWWRMLALRLRFVEHKAAATYLQSWGRMNNARAAFKIAAQEAKEQAKMENQLAALQKRLDDEATARSKMEAENAALQQRLLSGKVLPGDSEAQQGQHQQQQLVAGAGTIVVDQSILDESSQMLEFLQKENAKVKDENAKMHRDVAKLQREAAHLRQSADTAEATMKVLSQHAKALAQAHMKLQSSKEEADSTIKKSLLKEERLTEEIQMKHAMYIAEVNARIQDREVMGQMVSLAESDPNCPDQLVFHLRDLLEKSAQTGMVDEDPNQRQQGQPGYKRMSMMFKGLFD